MTVFHTGQFIHNFEKHYTEAISKQASITLKITKCTTIGPPRKGKTCLKYLLTGRKWDVKAGTASTDVMEAPEWVECYSLEEEEGAEELWKLLSPDQQKGKLFRDVNAACDTYTTNTSSDATTTNSDDTPSATPSDTTTDFSDVPPTSKGVIPTKTSSVLPPTSKGATPTKTSSNVQPTYKGATPTKTSSNVPPATIGDTIAPPPTTPPAWSPLRALKAIAGSQNKLEDLLKDKEGQILSKTRLVHFIDTGGQAIYHDVHPVLITSPSVYLVVFSLEELYQKESCEEQRAYFRSDLIQRPLRSIYTFGIKNSQEKRLQFHREDPTICIVGTHLDRVPRDQQFLEKLHEIISKEICNKPYREFVQYDPKGRSFWAVDNTLAGRKQSEADKEYISSFRSMVQDRSMEMSVDIPLTWMLLKFFMEGNKEKRYYKYSELLQVACSMGYFKADSPGTDLDTMLWLFHILGLLYHKVPTGFSKEESLVFSDPDCLYSATSDFLMAAKEEIEDSSEDQHHTQAATKEETKDIQGGSEKRQRKTQVASKKEMLCGREMAGKGSRPQKQKPNGIVWRKQVIQRIQCNSNSFKPKLEAVLQKAGNAMKHEATEAVLKSLHDQLKDIEEEYKLTSMKSCDASSMKAKQQLYVCRLVHGLANSVKALLDDASRKGDIHYVREEVNKAIEDIRRRYESRSIDKLIHVSDMKQFLELLSDLRIVAKLSDSDSYVIPAALPKMSHSKIVGNAAPVLFTVVSQTIMEVCFLPSGLFCCLISELVTEAGWTVDPLGRTHVAFAHKGLTGRVHMMEHESYIEIKLESQRSLEELSKAKTCQRVREMIHKHVVHVYKNLYSSPTTDSTFEESLVWGFQCVEHPDDTHIAAFHEEGDEFYAECLLQGCNQVQSVAPAHLVWASKVQQPIWLTKCIMFQTQDVGVQGQLKPTDKWVQYLQYVTPEQVQPLNTSKKIGWKLPKNGHVLLHIDVPSQQVYPLPLLITPVYCVYLVTFKLPEGKVEREEEGALKKIHNTLKDVYTFSSHVELGLSEGLYRRPKVFLVGLEPKKSVAEKSAFQQELSHMLEKRSYGRLIVPSEGGDPYWTNPGAELNIHGNPILLKRIWHYSCRPTQLIHQLLNCHCELIRIFTEVNPFILYEKVKAKMVDVASGICDSSNFEEFLKMLHSFGLIFYRSLPNLAQSENVVVLQPQCLYQLFEEVQKLSKKRMRVSTADLFPSATTHPEHVQKWFKAVCIDMNLVIEIPSGDNVFVMSLDPQCDLPSSAHYSVSPLLVAFRSQHFVHKESNCFLPSPLFPAFVTTLLKELKEYVMHQNKGGKQTEPQPIAMRQHYWHVGIHVEEHGAADIHVVERDSWIEIGLQHFHTGTVNQTEKQQLEKIQLFCQDIRRIVHKSAKGAGKLNKSSIHYGFYTCHSEHEGSFSEFDPQDGTLTCSYCNAPHNTTPQQRIWFNKFGQPNVSYVVCINIGMVSIHMFSVNLHSFEMLQC